MKYSKDEVKSIIVVKLKRKTQEQWDKEGNHTSGLLVAVMRLPTTNQEKKKNTCKKYIYIYTSSSAVEPSNVT